MNEGRNGGDPISGDPMIVLCDTREPWPHPWAVLLPEGWSLERAALETGDFVLSSHPCGAVVERKTPSDLASCIGAGRERFERELRRSRYAGRFVVVVEGSLSDVAVAGRKLHANSIMGTLAAWTLGFCPFVFAGSQRLAVDFAVRLFAVQLPEAERRRAPARRAFPQEEEGQPGALSNADAPPF